MTTRDVRWRVVNPDGTPAPGQYVYAELLAGDETPLIDAGTILTSISRTTSTVDGAADWEADAGGAGGWVVFSLTIQADIVPTGTRWQIRFPGESRSYQLVELEAGGPINGRDLVDGDPQDVTLQSALADHDGDPNAHGGLGGGSGVTLQQVRDDLGNTNLIAGEGLEKTYDGTQITLDAEVTQAELDAETAARTAGDAAAQAGAEQTAADALAAHEATRGQPDGVAALDGTGVVPDGQLPAGLTRDSELTAAISAAIDGLLDGAPGALDTLNELAAALGDDPNFAATVTAEIATKVAASLFDANTILTANVDDTPGPLTVGEQTVVGRITGGQIAALTAAQLRALINVEDGATADQAPGDIVTDPSGWNVLDGTDLGIVLDNADARFEEVRSTSVPRRLFETAQGVWTGDAPAGRTDYTDTIEFVGVSDPADGTNGIDTPANIVAGDVWRETASYVS